ncbi:MAG: glutamate-1-semialdehyde 2,1-aminomutase [Thermodesulfobacteriota bacterium]
MEKSQEKSRSLFAEAKKLIPGGVNSPVRACAAVGGEPRFILSARGAYLTDVDGNQYLDYVGSWGPLILGHADPAVIAAVAEAAERGTSFGAPTEAEIVLARLLVTCVPSMDMVRLVSSGTEAAMSAVRLARGATGRDLVIKFTGCYHGHSDSLLVEAGSGVATLGIPGSPGVPQAIASLTLSLPYNDPEAVSRAMETYGDRVACIIVEPVAGNMGVVPPEPGFLEHLRSVCDRFGTLLVFDEVITGFRLSLGGAQALYKITPDLTCLGKIIGGGLPMGAYGGRRDLMEKIAPAGPVYQAGTLSGNPLAVAAGIAAVGQLIRNGEPFYRELSRKAEVLVAGVGKAAEKHGITACANRVGSMSTLFFAPGPVKNYTDAKTSDTKAYGHYFRLMTRAGFNFAPSQFEALFVSGAHTDDDIEKTIAAADRAFAEMAKG